MPTYAATKRFLREFYALSPLQQALFLTTVAKLVEDLKRGSFRKSLRIKRLQSHPGVWELTWAPDGRALFKYGSEIHEGETHILWLRIGGHEIFKDER